MSETKREYYIQNLEEILESDLIKITHEAYFTKGTIKELLELLKEEPEPKTGEWTQIISIPNDMYGRYYCSECGKEGNPVWYFCPNCGADMREGDA